MNAESILRCKHSISKAQGQQQSTSYCQEEGSHLAMEEVLPDASSFPTNAAIAAVVNTLSWIIVPQLAYVAVVASGGHATVDANL